MTSKRLVLLAGFFLTFAPVASAHRLDEYLQATRLSLAPNQVDIEVDLTPGVDVAPMIFALINSDHDGRISVSEGETYAQKVVKEIALELDGHRMRLDLLKYDFPSFQEMSDGVGTIRIYARAMWAGSRGEHALSYQNSHQTNLGVYMVNALRPAKTDIEITQQRRDPLQRGIRLAFVIR